MYNDQPVDSSFHLPMTPFDDFESLCDINASLDNVMNLGVPLAHDPLFDCNLPNLGTCSPHPIEPYCVMPSPVSLSRLSDCPSNSNKHADVGQGAVAQQHRSNEEHRASQTNTQKPDQGLRNSKTKGNQRAHYAVEKRYRLTLNEKYATLGRTLSSEAVQRICRTDSQDGVPGLTDSSLTFSGGKDDSGGSGQRKTATLSMTIDTINVLSRCCSREAKELERLQSCVNDIRDRITGILEPKLEETQEQEGVAS